MTNIKSEAYHSLWEMRTGMWGDINFCQWVLQIFIMQCGLVRWWSSAQAKFQGKVFSGHRPLTPSSVPLQPDFSCCYICPVPTSQKPFLLYFIPVFLCRLLIPNAPSSQCLPLFDPTFSPTCSRPLVPTVFQLPLLRCLLFLASLLSQPSNTWSTAPRPSFKPHEFLNGFLLQSSITPAQWLSPSTSRFEKKRVSLISVSTPKPGVTETLGKIWSLRDL